MPENRDEKIGTGYYVHKGRKEGLPQHVKEYLKKFKGSYPTEHCLSNEEMAGNDESDLLERMRHIVKCKFCKSVFQFYTSLIITIADNAKPKK